MPDNLRYIHGVWLVVRPTIYFTNTEATVSWTSSRGVELMATEQRRQTEEEKEKGQIKKTVSETSTSLSAIITACTELGHRSMARLTSRDRTREPSYFHDTTRSLTKFNHVDIQVVTIRLMTCHFVHSLRVAPRCC